jgi:serine/threonine-protein kinase
VLDEDMIDEATVEQSRLAFGIKSLERLDLTGKTIDGRFEVERLLAEGGMGQVYLARQLSLDRRVALKVFRAEGQRDAQGAHRFANEALAAARLVSSHAVLIHDYGQLTDGLRYIAMEYVEGQPLSRLIRQDGPFSAERAVSLAGQLLECLAEAHGHEIVHRDIKPQNILIKRTATGREIAKLTDFGIARFASEDLDRELVRAGILVGTPQYVSPEQVRNEPADSRSDLYSLGIVLYEMLSGKPPFNDPLPSRTLMLHLEEPPKPLELPGPSHPHAAEIVRVVHWALAKEPGHRPQTAAALQRALEDALAGQSTSAPRFISAEMTVMLPEALAISGALVPTDAQWTARPPTEEVPAPLREGPKTLTAAASPRALLSEERTVAAPERLVRAPEPEVLHAQSTVVFDALPDAVGHTSVVPKPAAAALPPKPRVWPWFVSGAAVVLAAALGAWLVLGRGAAPAQPTAAAPPVAPAVVVPPTAPAPAPSGAPAPSPAAAASPDMRGPGASATGASPGPAPAAPPPSAPPRPSEAPPQPAEVKPTEVKPAEARPGEARMVRIVSTPPGAYVVEAGLKVGWTPFTLRLEGEARSFTLELKGYKDHVQLVDDSAPEVIEVALVPR